ncbi:hypothetical protein [Marinigracilibium pacificum]|uniref:Uncharacterized protein n=1 Tax=Marinigracilibium pacificum TaxID=2729599 RepID=A0A848IXS2_9BACT|nr:hypothetical protein [Marinigracilibium pacificum]NMM46769.1 hypothetical protein [Marinigracilibium pacificum]
MSTSKQPKYLLITILFILLTVGSSINTIVYAIEPSKANEKSVVIKSDSLHQVSEVNQENSNVSNYAIDKKLSEDKKESEEQTSPLSNNFFLKVISKFSLSEYFDFSLDFNFF